MLTLERLFSADKRLNQCVVIRVKFIFPKSVETGQVKGSIKNEECISAVLRHPVKI